MKTRIITCCMAALWMHCSAADPVVLTILQTEDNQSKDISISASQMVEVLTAYDFYGAAATIVIEKGETQLYVAPGSAEGGLPHCRPYPLVLAGPAKISLLSGDTSAARTESTPFLVTLKISRIQAPRGPPAPRKKTEGERAVSKP